MFSGPYQRQHQTQGRALQALSMSMSFTLKIRTLHKRHSPFPWRQPSVLLPFIVGSLMVVNR